MAFIACAYDDKIKSLEQEDCAVASKGHYYGCDRKGKLRTEAKQAFIHNIFPNPSDKD
jgi:hypothetical protein